MSTLAAVVVPCYNEAERLDRTAIAGLTRVADRVVLVDDGSVDDTAGLLAAIRSEHPSDIEVLELEHNRGKADAVRLGMQFAVDRWDLAHVGYLDADLATPPAEFARLLEIARRRPELAAVIGSRVALLGHRVHRRPLRHYTGRVYATLSSLVLGVAVYDTQCGAKVFRVDAALECALASPFVDRWAFDVELLGRIQRANSGRSPAMLEMPLDEWHDVSGSKVGIAAGVRSTLSLLRVRRALATWPAGQSGRSSDMGNDTTATL
jgi:dolichyl-phosphate beta-glucosyltransferase